MATVVDVVRCVESRRTILEVRYTTVPHLVTWSTQLADLEENEETDRSYPSYVVECKSNVGTVGIGIVLGLALRPPPFDSNLP